MDDDRRNFKRHQALGLKSNISDGNSAFLVVVEDLSKTGVGLSQVPAKFDETVKKCLAVVNGPHNDFKLDLNPRWVQLSEKGKHKNLEKEAGDLSFFLLQEDENDSIHLNQLQQKQNSNIKNIPKRV